MSQACFDAQVNTVAQAFVARGMQHTEGGWPKEVDHTEAEHVIRYRKKARRRLFAARGRQNNQQWMSISSASAESQCSRAPRSIA